MTQQNTQTEEKKDAVVTTETKVETKTETKKESKPVVKKTEAMARGDSIRASRKHCQYICTFIKGKTPDQAIKELEQVIKLKRAIPYKGEVPHRKGMMSGRYPVDASKIFIPMLKGLKGNIIANGMDVEKSVIVSGVSNWAARPQKRSGGKGKRTHVTLIAREAKK
jgi:ribosomal protein L22